MIYNLRVKFADFLLKRKVAGKRRNVAVCNLEDAKSVGILFNALDESTYKTVKTYVNKLRSEGIRKVMALGYVDTKVVPAYLPYKVYLDFISKSDLNKFLIPVSSSVDNFLNETYDILIDISEDDCFPMRYMLVMADAKLKVGKCCNEKNEYYDLRIEIEERKTVGYLTEQIDRYLRMINKRNYEKQI